MSSSSQLCRREYTASQQQRWYGPHENSGAENKNPHDIKDILLWRGQVCAGRSSSPDPHEGICL